MQTENRNGFTGEAVTRFLQFAKRLDLLESPFAEVADDPVSEGIDSTPHQIALEVCQQLYEAGVDLTENFFTWHATEQDEIYAGTLSDLIVPVGSIGHSLCISSAPKDAPVIVGQLCEQGSFHFFVTLRPILQFFEKPSAVIQEQGR